MGGPSGPILFGSDAVPGPKSVGPEGPPTTPAAAA
ncbi:DUF6053 domain-containing protein [Lysobacter enzymogenes]